VGERRVRIRRSDLERFLERGRTAPADEAGRSLADAFWEGELATEAEPAENG
jgi:hypothetical protein